MKVTFLIIPAIPTGLTYLTSLSTINFSFGLSMMNSILSFLKYSFLLLLRYLDKAIANPSTHNRSYLLAGHSIFTFSGLSESYSASNP